MYNCITNKCFGRKNFAQKKHKQNSNMGRTNCFSVSSQFPDREGGRLMYLSSRFDSWKIVSFCFESWDIRFTMYIYQAPHANRNSAPKIGFKKIRVETSTWISFPVFKGEFLYHSGFGPRFFYIRVWAPKFSKRIFFHSEHARSRVIAQHMRRHPRRKTLEWCITQTNNKPKSILYTALPHHVFWCFGHCPHQLLCIIPMFPQRH